MVENTKRVAVLIDAENISKALIKPMLQAVSAYGQVATKRAYADFSEENMHSWRGIINQHAIKVQHQFSFTRGKNATDIMMVIDAMDLLSSGKYDVFVLVSSDSDFTPLAMRLKESDKMVIGVGEKKAPQSFKNACDVFVSASELLNTAVQSPGGQEAITGELAEQVVTEGQTQSDKKNTLGDAISTESKRAKGDNALVLNDKQSEPSKPAVLSVSELKIPLNERNVAQLVKWLADAAQRYQEDTGWTNQCSVPGYIKAFNPRFSARDYGVKSLPALMAKLHKYIELEKFPVKGGGTQWFYRMKKSFCYDSVA